LPVQLRPADRVARDVRPVDVAAVHRHPVKTDWAGDDEGLVDRYQNRENW